MSVCINVYAACLSYQAGMYRFADWARANPTYFKIVSDIRQLRQND